ncbi:v-SNARE, coiled-coil homology domain [Dillenia turbinata]|uniref:V-SNARE, coiled-coil homology domain n=1 Tax=Dillenia turbinata TaxID=194707 RepID=A0AAN8UGV2_9MAGN
MGQESFVYSFVARGTMILAEFTEFTGNFPSIAAQCLQRLPSSNNKFTYNCDHHTFNFLVQDGYAYCIVAKESVGKQLCIAFLERIRADFKKRYGGGKADTATAKSLNKDFGPIMKEHMQDVIDHDEEIGKLSKVKAQVSEVKSIMVENIDKALERGENLTALADKTETLRAHAQEFKKQGTQVRRKMWYQNMKIKLVVFGILFLLILIIWVSICHGFDCTN